MTLYGTNIQGPDDLIAAPDYETAIKIANAFNDWWRRYVHASPRTENDPLMWAVPVEWPHDEASHAAALANPSSEYSGFVEAAKTL